ncbi:MAG: nuclear transport factor 2 family protein [Solirubrobacteraceae bacterium]
MSEELIERLYRALDNHDGEAMAACYTPGAVFEDPAFGELRDGDAQRMWRMLAERAGELSVTLLEHASDGETGSARWEARYDFAGTGRRVVNVVASRFRFADGLIAEQRDSFDLRGWAAQALGPPGRVLGMTPLLGPLIRRRTRAQLAAFKSSGQ